MSDRPDFDELAGGDDLSPEEAARLERVHNLLIEAGPPPELPPHLLHEPDPEGGRRDNVVGLPRRRTGMLLGIAAALTLTAFLGGFVYGTRHAPFNEDFSVPMHSTAAGSPAKAVIHVGKIDSAGNWPLKVDVENLPELPKGQYYEMFLSRGSDKRAASCGTFRVSGSTDDIRLNAPYRLNAFNGWIVTREKPGSAKHPVVLTTA
jgi:Anti-sigma-K factor rskA